jgi:hypothetical protein
MGGMEISRWHRVPCSRRKSEAFRKRAERITDCVGKTQTRPCGVASTIPTSLGAAIVSSRSLQARPNNARYKIQVPRRARVFAEPSSLDSQWSRSLSIVSLPPLLGHPTAPVNIHQVTKALSQLYGDNPASAKRKRIALACDTCRERKVRCDGAKPVCGPCQRRNQPVTQCGYKVIADCQKRLLGQEYVPPPLLQH